MGQRGTLRSRLGIAERGPFDPAVNWVQPGDRRDCNGTRRKAHLQIGLCAARTSTATRRRHLIVPYTFDYPEISATALCGSRPALVEDKKPETERLLRKVVKDYPTSEWAKVAQERLEKLQK